MSNIYVFNNQLNMCIIIHSSVVSHISANINRLSTLLLLVH